MMKGDSMRTQNCREKIHKTAEMCDLSPETVAEIDRVTGFVEEHKELSRLTTDAIKPLMKISDPEKQKEAISHVEKALNRKTPTGGAIKKRLTKPEVEKIVEKVSPSEIPNPKPTIISPPIPVGLNEEQKKRLAKEKMINAATAFVSLIPLSKQNAITRYMEAAHVETDADFLIKAIDLTLDLVGDI
jgi:hypothetical protein